MFLFTVAGLSILPWTDGIVLCQHDFMAATMWVAMQIQDQGPSPDIGYGRND
jgi:hypothetical protein